MVFSISSDELRDHLSIVNGAISSNPNLPILEDFLFTIKGDKLMISASDLDTSISTELNVQADEEGAVAIPAKILLETLKALPTQPINFKVDMGNFGVEITSAYGKYKIAGEDGADYPHLAEANEVDSVEVPAYVLHNGINKSIFATSNDELRPAMTGVLVQVDFNSVTFVATDAHKLVKYAFSNIPSDVNTSFIVPKKALNLLKNALPTGDDKVIVSFNKNNAFFNFDNVKLTCRLIDARYPDYNAVIPQNNPNKMSITKSDFQHSLKRIVIYSNKTTNQVVLNLSDGSLTVSAQDLDFSNEATEQLPCSYDGESMAIGFNAKFLVEMLNTLDSDQVVLELSNPGRAGLLLPSEQKPNEDLLMLVMPVMLGN